MTQSSQSVFLHAGKKGTVEKCQVGKVEKMEEEVEAKKIEKCILRIEKFKKQMVSGWARAQGPGT